MTKYQHFINYVSGQFERKPLLSMLIAGFVAGLITSFAMAPYSLWIALFIGFPILYLLVAHSKTKVQAFLSGWGFGFGYFLFSLYWIANALLIEGNNYEWAWPIAVMGLPAFLAFFPALACLASWRFLNLKSIAGFLGFCAFLSLSEWLRGHILSGFPWNLYGYGWASVHEMLQSLSLANVYFLTALSIFWGALPGFLLTHKTLTKPRLTLSLIALGILILVMGFGTLRLQSAPNKFHDVNVKVVQPNIPQSEKWDPLKRSAHFRHFLKLSAASPDDTLPTYIIWPETAISQQHLDDPFVINAIADMLNAYPEQASLFTGVLRHSSATNAYYNSIIMINRDGKIRNIYDKSHLVPFGEYIPLQSLIPLRAVNQLSGFKAGAGVQTLNTPEDLTYSPLVCYEVLFPGGVTKYQNKPNFIVNVTNDAWYGSHSGPQQHLQKARFRAIEEGIPLLRSVNTGISAIINPYGQVLEAKNMNKTGVIRTKLPMKVEIYALQPVYQNAIFLALVGVFGIFGVYYRMRDYKH